MLNKNSYEQQMLDKIVDSLPIIDQESNTYIQFSEAPFVNQFADGTYINNTVEEKELYDNFINIFTCNRDGLLNWCNLLQIGSNTEVREYYRQLQFGDVESPPIDTYDHETESPQNFHEGDNIGGNFNETFINGDLSDEQLRLMILMKYYSYYASGAIINVAQVMNKFLHKFPNNPNFIVADVLVGSEIQYPSMIYIYYDNNMGVTNPLRPVFESEKIRYVLENSDILPKEITEKIQFIYRNPLPTLEELAEYYVKPSVTSLTKYDTDEVDESNFEPIVAGFAFAEGAANTQLPFDADPNVLSQKHGFGRYFALAPGKDTLARCPTRGEMDGIFNQVYSNIMLLLKTGKNKASDLFAARGNPYMKGDMCFENGLQYISLVDNNIAPRINDYVNWVRTDIIGGITPFPCLIPTVQAQAQRLILCGGEIVSIAAYQELYNFAVASNHITDETTWQNGKYYGWFANQAGGTMFRLPDYRSGVMTGDLGDDRNPSAEIGRFMSGRVGTHNHTASQDPHTHEDSGHIHPLKTLPIAGTGGPHDSPKSDGNAYSDKITTGYAQLNSKQPAVHINNNADNQQNTVSGTSVVYYIRY